MSEAVRGADHEGVEGVLRVHPEADLRLHRRLRIGHRGALRLGGDVEPHRTLAGDLSERGADQPEEMTVDPLAREVVGNGENELVLGNRCGVDLAEPGRERVLVECLPEPTRNLVPDPSRSQLDWLLHPVGTLLCSTEKKGEHSNVGARTQWPFRRIRIDRKMAIYQGFSQPPTYLSTPVDLCLDGRRPDRWFGSAAPVDVHHSDTNVCGQATPSRSSILAPRRARLVALSLLRSPREADLSAQRSTPEA